jgi:hypothetical protein
MCAPLPSHGHLPAASVDWLKRMLLAAHAPGAATPNTVKTLPRLRGWYQLYGAEYLRHIQAK